jgi:hypothetical protein
MSIDHSLHVQQTHFSAAILAREVDAAPLQALFHGAPEHITQRLAIYRANLQAARVGALQTAFPTVARIVGDEFFAALAREYGRAHPSANGNLNHFGAAFSEFLAGFAPAEELPYLPDVAALDWAMHQAESAADVRPLDLASLVQALGTHAADQVTLQLHPSVALVRSRFPLADIWHYNASLAAGKAIDRLELPNWDIGQSVLVHRATWRVAVLHINEAEALAIDAVQHGESLQHVLSNALAADAKADLVSLLSNWCSTGILMGINSTLRK